MLSNYIGNSNPSPGAQQSNKPVLVVFDGDAPVTNANFVDNETPDGIINGTDGTDGNAVFTLDDTPDPAASLQLFKTDIGTGVLMIAGIHYNLVGDTITYTANNIPIAGQTHRAWYRIASV